MILPTSNSRFSLKEVDLQRRCMILIIVAVGIIAFYKFLIPSTIDTHIGYWFPILFSIGLASLAYFVPTEGKSYYHTVYIGLLLGLLAGLITHVILSIFLYGFIAVIPKPQEGIGPFLLRFLMVQLALLTPFTGTFVLVILRLLGSTRKNQREK